MITHHTQEIAAAHLRPGDRIRRDGKDFVVQLVRITAGEAVFLELLAANDNAGAPVQLRLDGETLLRQVP